MSRTSSGRSALRLLQRRNQGPLPGVDRLLWLRGMPAELDEATPLNSIQWSEQPREHPQDQGGHR